MKSLYYTLQYLLKNLKESLFFGWRLLIIKMEFWAWHSSACISKVSRCRPTILSLPPKHVDSQIHHYTIKDLFQTITAVTVFTAQNNRVDPNSLMKNMNLMMVMKRMHFFLKAGISELTWPIVSKSISHLIQILTPIAHWKVMIAKIISLND